MNTLAYDGPGPWILFFPLIWAAVVVSVVTVLLVAVSAAAWFIPARKALRVNTNALRTE